MTSPDRNISKFKVGLKNNLIEGNLNLNDSRLNMLGLYQALHWMQDLKLKKKKITLLLLKFHAKIKIGVSI